MFFLAPYILSVVAVLNFLMGVVVFYQSKKDKINKIFTLLSFSVTAWSFSIFGFHFLELPYYFSKFWIVLSHVSALLVAFIFFNFSLNFPSPINKEKKIASIASIPLLIAFYYLYFSEFIIGDIVGDGYEINSGYIFYSLLVICYFMASFFYLFLQYKNRKDHIKKNQIRYIVLGALFSSTLALTTDLIFPFLGVFRYIWLGPFFTLALVLSVAMAIFKYHLFNIKIIATELLTFTIWFVLLIKLLMVQNLRDFLIDGGLFLLVIFFGILLIRSALKEVKMREKLELMTQNLIAANARLKELDKAKSEFVSITSHQLRSPLTSIKGYASMILEGSFGIIPKKAQDAVGRIMKSSQSLIDTIEDFLDVGRIESGKMKYVWTEFDLEKMLGDIVKDFVDNVQKARDLNLEFVVSGNGFAVTADQNKIRQVLSNLIDNSIKYTPSGSVKAFLSKSKKDGCVMVEIKDTGVGIEPEIVGKLFHKFSRVDGIQLLHTEGLGLGLYVAQKIVEAHKGKIWVESEGEGKGSSFFVKLPIDLS